MGIVYIEELPDVVLDARGAKLSYVSGGQEYLRKYPMDLWREFIEREATRLLAFDEAERRRVVAFPKRPPRKH